MVRPADDHRSTNASLVHHTLGPTKGTIAVEEFQIGTTAALGAIVRGEKHNRVLLQLQTFEQFHYFAHLPIEPSDHRRIGCSRLFLVSIVLCFGDVRIRFLKQTSVFLQ